MAERVPESPHHQRESHGMFGRQLTPLQHPLQPPLRLVQGWLAQEEAPAGGIERPVQPPQHLKKLRSF